MRTIQIPDHKLALLASGLQDEKESYTTFISLGPQNTFEEILGVTHFSVQRRGKEIGQPASYVHTQLSILEIIISLTNLFLPHQFVQFRILPSRFYCYKSPVEKYRIILPKM